jgi:hypothetical protein
MAEQEQTAVLDTEQTQTQDDGQTLEAVTTPEPAESVRAEAEAAGVNLSTFDGIEAFRKEHPEFEQYLKKVQDDGFNAGRQKRDKELRLERGNEEVARKVMDSFAQKYGVELDDADRRDLPLWVDANRTVERVAAATRIITKGLDSFALDDEAKAAYIEQIAALADEPDRLESIAEQVMRAGSGTLAQQSIGGLTLAEVPKDSRLHASIQAHLEAEQTRLKEEMEKELAARASEREPVENRPRLPNGSAPAGGAERYMNMTAQEASRLPASEYRDWQRAISGVGA